MSNSKYWFGTDKKGKDNFQGVDHSHLLVFPCGMYAATRGRRIFTNPYTQVVGGVVVLVMETLTHMIYSHCIELTIVLCVVVFIEYSQIIRIGFKQN